MWRVASWFKKLYMGLDFWGSAGSDFSSVFSTVLPVGVRSCRVVAKGTKKAECRGLNI